MFDDLPVLVEAENVNACPIVIAWPFLKAIQDDEVSLSNHPLEVRAFTRVFLGHPREVLNECILTVSHCRVMLNIYFSRVFLDSLSRPTLIKHQIIESHRILFVLFKLISH